MISDYIKHSQGLKIEKNKQNENMSETVKEFQRLKANFNQPLFKVLSVEEMPQRVFLKKDYLENVQYQEKMSEMEIIAVKNKI